MLKIVSVFLEHFFWVSLDFKVIVYFVSKIVQTCFEKKIVLVIEKYLSKFKIESQECWNSSRTNWDVEKWKKQVRYILSKNKKTIWQLIVRKNWENMFCILWLLVGNVKPKPTPHCWGHQVQKVDTEAKFYVILFVMINALIWCNFEKNRLGSFWDNPIYPIRYLHGQDLDFFLKSKTLRFL